MENIIEQDRKIVYSYFDEVVVPLLREFGPYTEQEYIEFENQLKKDKPNYIWCLKRYDDTYRVSARSMNNYMYFMIWTPADQKEYCVWPSHYHGSRRRNNEQDN